MTKLFSDGSCNCLIFERNNIFSLPAALKNKVSELSHIEKRAIYRIAVIRKSDNFWFSFLMEKVDKNHAGFGGEIEIEGFIYNIIVWHK